MAEAKWICSGVIWNHAKPGRVISCIRVVVVELYGRRVKTKTGSFVYACSKKSRVLPRES